MLHSIFYSFVKLILPVSNKLEGIPCRCKPNISDAQIVKSVNIFAYLNFCRTESFEYQQLLKSLVHPLEDTQILVSHQSVIFCKCIINNQRLLWIFGT